MRDLRHLGVYTVVGTPYVLFAVSVGGRAFFLYDRGRGIDFLPLFVVDREGRVRFSFGAETPWTTQDLEDTGEDFKPVIHP